MMQTKNVSGLVVGQTYHCETYSGDVLLLKYLGYEEFAKDDGTTLFIEGGVRYIYDLTAKEIDAMWVAAWKKYTKQ